MAIYLYVGPINHKISSLNYINGIITIQTKQLVKKKKKGGFLLQNPPATGGLLELSLLPKPGAEKKTVNLRKRTVNP